MAHPLNDHFDRLDGKKTTDCNEKCKHWFFPHLDTACVLSEVFSVAKGKPCYIFEEKK